MTTTQKASGGSLVSTLAVVALLVAAIGLYLRVVMVEGDRHADVPAPQASVRVVEGDEPVLPTDAGLLRELPGDQRVLIREIFAPELSE
jgi:hypothetical protein